MPYTYKPTKESRPVNVFLYGEKGSGLRQKGPELLDFYKIRELCVQKKTLFEDPDFPAINESVYYKGDVPSGFEWKRPSEICNDPKFIVEGATRFDIKQGYIGNCWFLAAAANLTLNDSIFQRVVPDDQSFVENYAGIFHFRFWQYGKWVDVVVDDRLPTKRGNLMFMYSRDKNEFWGPLLEKAYAKIHGSYESLSGGRPNEAMEDFTGGICELFKCKEVPPNFFDILQKAYDRWSLIGLGISGVYGEAAVMESGLVRGHAYSVTKVKLVDVPGKEEKVQLLRIRNPWGTRTEWKGAWSDQSPEWEKLSAEQKEEMGLKVEYDGEFWMELKDVLENFNFMEICNLNPDSLKDEPKTHKCKKKWETNCFDGAWVKDLSAGGRQDNFWMNPQFRVDLEYVDEDDDDNLCTMIVGLMQKNRRSLKKLGEGHLFIGFYVYQLQKPEELPKPLSNVYFNQNRTVGKYPGFINSREVTYRYKLPPGTYCIVPCTYYAEKKGEFVVRVFTEQKNVMREYDEDINITEASEDLQASVDASEEELKNEELRKLFADVSGPDLEVDCYELQEVLGAVLKYESQTEGFSLDVCRSLIATMDVDRSGKLGLEEFMHLCKDVRTWKNVFKKYDSKNSGYIHFVDLREAFQDAGFSLNFHVLLAMDFRYSKKGQVNFDDFLMAAIKLKHTIETFREKDPEKTGKATFTLDEWVLNNMYN